MKFVTPVPVRDLSIRSMVMVGNEEVLIPPEFWDGISAIDENGALNKKQRRRLWKMLGRADRCPEQLVVMVNREDVERAFPTRH